RPHRLGLVSPRSPEHRQLRHAARSRNARVGWWLRLRRRRRSDADRAGCDLGRGAYVAAGSESHSSSPEVAMRSLVCVLVIVAPALVAAQTPQDPYGSGPPPATAPTAPPQYPYYPPPQQQY